MNRKELGKLLLVISAVCAILALVSYLTGMNKITEYYYSEYASSERLVNAYVGGDAYNFIINGTYFAGYMALTAGFLVSASMFLISSLYLSCKHTEIQKFTGASPVSPAIPVTADAPAVPAPENPPAENAPVKAEDTADTNKTEKENLS